MQAAPADIPTEPAEPADVIANAIASASPTPLAAALPSAPLVPFAGVRTAPVYTQAASELLALRGAAGVYDLGWRCRLRVTGEDRVRWLNGMATNTVKDLKPGTWNYTFLLNAQGRIQGDAEVYCLPDRLLLATDRTQLEPLRQHLDRFIIMDDVELLPEPEMTALGVAGPTAAQVLQQAGFASEQPATGTFTQQGDLLLARESGLRYTLWMPAGQVLQVWQQLLAAGAQPCGLEAVEALRILCGLPRYGAEIDGKTLAQETGQTRALNFNKGCYLGQEIVERIRSRATVHRALRVFALNGVPPAPGTGLFVPAKPESAVGELRSITPLKLNATLDGQTTHYGLGMVRTEAAEAPLSYAGGTAQALATAPLAGF